MFIFTEERSMVLIVWIKRYNNMFILFCICYISYLCTDIEQDSKYVYSIDIFYWKFI